MDYLFFTNFLMDARAKLKEQSNEVDDGDGSTKKKLKVEYSQFPLGVYEAHTGLVYCECFDDYPCGRVLKSLSRSIRYSANAMSLGASGPPTGSGGHQGWERCMGTCMG